MSQKLIQYGIKTETRAETIKLLESDMENVPWYWSCIDFFGYGTKSNSNSKTHKWDYLKPKSFCTEKEAINKIKQQSIELEKIFENNISGQELKKQNI